jgi:glycosyltransferase involved in cell wall biosynthesis
MFVAHHVGGPGGMERQSGRLVLGLLDAGHRVTVVARRCSIAPRENLTVVHVRSPRRPAAIAFPLFFLMASLKIARRRPATLHTTGALVGNRAQVSTVHFCHRAAATRLTGSRASRANPLYRLNTTIASWLSRLAESWCYRPGRTTLLCAVSNGVAAELREHFPASAERIRTVPNGVDSSEFRPDEASRPALRTRLGIANGTPLALFVGGDWERKGLRPAVDALALARDWHLAVAGHGEPTELRARAGASGAASRLHFLGPVAHMPPIYAAADAFVLPTAYEAFPLVCLEAAASGLPLLVTRVNGVEDLLRDGRNGWFVRPDGPEIATRLNELAADADLARRMATEARSAAARFTWEAMVTGYLEIYSELRDRGRRQFQPSGRTRRRARSGSRVAR